MMNKMYRVESKDYNLGGKLLPCSGFRGWTKGFQTIIIVAKNRQISSKFYESLLLIFISSPQHEENRVIKSAECFGSVTYQLDS